MRVNGGCKGNNPKLGERKSRYIWHACIDCGKEQWVTFSKGKPISLRCKSCAGKGEKNGRWKDGVCKINGYIYVTLSPDDFFLPMATIRRYLRESRVVMARHLGRNLHSREIVHHKNGITVDDRIENLELTTNGSHSRDHNKGYTDGYAKGLIDGRDKQITELRQQVKLLQWQVKQIAETPQQQGEEK